MLSLNTKYVTLCFNFPNDQSNFWTPMTWQGTGENDNVKCILEKSLVVTLTTTRLEFAWDDALQICTLRYDIYLQLECKYWNVISVSWGLSWPFIKFHWFYSNHFIFPKFLIFQGNVFQLKKLSSFCIDNHCINVLWLNLNSDQILQIIHEINIFQFIISLGLFSRCPYYQEHS